MKEKHSKYYKKIFHSYLIIFTVLALIVDVLVGNSVLANREKKAIKTQAFFEENCVLTDNKIQAVSRLIERISAKTEVKSYAEEPHAGYQDRNFYSYVQISKILNEYMTSYNEYECRMSASRVWDGILVYGGNTINLDKSLAERGLTQEDLIALFDGETAGSSAVLYIPDDDVTYYISFIYRKTYASGNAVYFFVDFDKNYFFPAAGVDPDEFFGVIDERNGTLRINRSGEKDRANELLTRILESKAAGSEDGREMRGVFTRPSRVIREMRYLYYDRDVSSVQSYITLTLLLLLAWAVLMMAGAGISRFIARKIYGPVGMIFGVLDENGSPEYGDEMNYLRDSVSYLVSNNKRLTELAETNRTYLRNGFLRDMLTGSVYRSQIEENLATYELEYLERPCFCILCEYTNIDPDSQNADYRKAQTLRNVFLGVAEQYFKNTGPCEVVGIDRNRFAVIAPEAAEREMNEAAPDLIGDAEEKYGIDLVMAFGNPVGSIYDIYDSYMTAVRLFEYKVMLSDRPILREEDLGSLNYSGYYYPVEVEKNLIYNVLEGNREKCGEILDNIFTVNFDELSLDAQNIKDFNFVVTETVKRILKQLGKTPEDIFGKDVIIYLELNCAAEKAESETVIRGIIDRLSQYAYDHIKARKNGVTKNIIEYIDANYHRDISLADVADHIGLSQGHISRLLKNELDTSFKQYLNQHRIEVAKQLLAEDDLPVGEVAQKVGCNSTMTFIRMFKRYTGVSPGDYKKTQK